MFSLFRVASLIATAMLAGNGLVALAQQNLPIAECAQRLRASGLRVIDQEVDNGFYEFETRKGNQTWDIKTDLGCNILLERIDS